MAINIWLIGAFWLVFAGYWAVSAFGAKRNIGVRAAWRQRAIRLSLIVLILIAVRTPAVRHALQMMQVHMADSMVMASIGVAMCAAGIAFAIWARTCLGRNWGMPMSRKENPELITTGPYAFVRHPIYSGMLLAMLGSAFGLNVAWALALILFGAYFIYSARREEALLTQQFPQQYPAYVKRTKMLVPFVL
jgi:protein-S-isoprenylcysteine O-methyltransferase Ste14